MAEIRIRLVFNLETGKKDIYIDFESDSDALPIEHEESHRDIVRQLIGRNALSEDEAGEIVVNRNEPERTGRESRNETAEPDRQAETGG